jgi:hypothetical protein
MAAEKLQLQYLNEITARLTLLAGENSDLVLLIQNNTKERVRRARQEKLFPYIILIITLALCIFMYLYGL